MMKKSLIFSITSLVVAICVAAGTLFAWFTGGDAAYELQFSIAVVDMKLILYRIDDFDLDGVPDLDADGNYITKTIFDTSEATSDEQIQEAMKTGDSIENFMPSQVYTYRLDVYNSGDVDSFLNLNMTTNVPQGYTISYKAFWYKDGVRDDLDLTDAEVASEDEIYINGDEEANSAPVPLVTDSGKTSLELYIQVIFESAEGTDGDTVDGSANAGAAGYGTKFYITISA